MYHVNKIMHFKLTGKTTSDGGFNWPAEEGQAIQFIRAEEVTSRYDFCYTEN